MGGEDITNMPGISQLGPWVLVAVLLVPKLWDSVLILLGKKQESSTALATAGVSVEIERIKGEFDRQKDFQNDLIEECQRLRDLCKQQSEHALVLMGSVLERDAIIRERDKTVLDMQRQMDRMQTELDSLARHVKTIEADRDRLKTSCSIVVLEPPHE